MCGNDNYPYMYNLISMHDLGHYSRPKAKPILCTATTKTRNGMKYGQKNGPEITS